MKNTVTAIDFGTSKIVALVAETSGRQRCDIIGAGTVEYSGFADGQWNEPEILNEKMSAAVKKAEELLRAASAQGGFSLAEARDTLGCPRKYAQQIVEYFDLMKITRWDGERRFWN